MSKSILYAVSSVAQSVVSTGSNITYENLVRKAGCNVALSGGNIVTKGEGYYDVYANLTFTATAAGTAIVRLSKDGVAIPGASAEFTTAENSTYAISIPCVIRNSCCRESNVVVNISGVAGTVVNASIEVKKF